MDSEATSRSGRERAESGPRARIPQAEARPSRRGPILGKPESGTLVHPFDRTNDSSRSGELTLRESNARVTRNIATNKCRKAQDVATNCESLGSNAGAVRHLSFADCETKHLVRR
jgi:hypothetical protein